MADATSSSSGGGVVAEVRAESASNSQRTPLLLQQQPPQKGVADSQPKATGHPDSITNVQDNAAYRPMNSFRTRLRQARREPVGPVVVAEWETRGHFWSALDSAAPRDPSQNKAGAVQRWGQRAKVRLENTATVVRLRPSVLVWPLLLCALCLIGGLVGVEMGARHDRQLKEDDATAAASQAASSLSMALEESLQPLRTLEMHVQLRPAMGQLGPRFQDIAQQLVLEAPLVVASLLLAPFGVVRAVYSSAQVAVGSGAASAALGVTVLPPEQVQSSQLQSILLRSPATLTGVPATSGGSGGSGSMNLVVAHKPVLVPGAAADETWGNAPPDSGSSSALYAADGGKLWGFTSTVLDVGSTLGGQEAGLQSLRAMGYLYRAQLISNDTGAVLAELDSSPPLPAGSNPVTVSQPAQGVAGTWLIQVAPDDGWEPEWKPAMTAVVVVVAVVLSVMLFAALVLQYRHVMFLEALLPEKVISVLDTGRPFYEHLDNVTVLYADIVRYSNAPKGMPPWEVVKLLNDVNKLFDGLLEKHGLTKIRRSGEAFMAVGGCPTPGDPVSTAVRVALCAREMVLATAAFRSSAGQRVQIRLGLHSGPAVAAVLGTELPRFSLLGDTVDIAHFMESTSNIMGVHVSDTTAELLSIADDPLVMLKPRGVIDIKGRGPITTFWLQIDLFGPMNTFADQPTSNSTHLLSASAARPGADGGGARAGSGGGADGEADGRRRSGGGAAAAAPADIACTADLAVAATLGMRGAPLVRKLSQTGLTQTRRALPDRRTRATVAPYDNSILGSFTMQLDPDSIAIFKAVLARPSGVYDTLIDLRRGSGGGAAARRASRSSKAAVGGADEPEEAGVEGASGKEEEEEEEDAGALPRPAAVLAAPAMTLSPAELERSLSAVEAAERLRGGAEANGVDTAGWGSGAGTGEMGGSNGTGGAGNRGSEVGPAVIELAEKERPEAGGEGGGRGASTKPVAVPSPPAAVLTTGAAAPGAVTTGAAVEQPGLAPGAASFTGLAAAASSGGAAAAHFEIEEAG